MASDGSTQPTFICPYRKIYAGLFSSKFTDRLSPVSRTYWLFSAVHSEESYQSPLNSSRKSDYFHSDRELGGSGHTLRLSLIRFLAVRHSLDVKEVCQSALFPEYTFTSLQHDSSSRSKKVLDLWHPLDYERCEKHLTDCIWTDKYMQDTEILE